MDSLSLSTSDMVCVMVIILAASQQYMRLHRVFGGRLPEWLLAASPAASPELDIVTASGTATTSAADVPSGSTMPSDAGAASTSTMWTRREPNSVAGPNRSVRYVPAGYESDSDSDSAMLAALRRPATRPPSALRSVIKDLVVDPVICLRMVLMPHQCEVIGHLDICLTTGLTQTLAIARDRGILEVAGPKAAVVKYLVQLLEPVADYGLLDVVCLLPDSSVGGFIGHGGRHIKIIEREYSLRINVSRDRLPGCAERGVTVFGPIVAAIDLAAKFFHCDVPSCNRYRLP